MPGAEEGEHGYGGGRRYTYRVIKTVEHMWTERFVNEFP